jgi:hypothetical protein
MIRHLTTPVCPTCFAAPYQEGVEVYWGTNEGVINVHANGQRWEWRQFLCGCRVMWIPNFEKAEVVRGYECSNSPEVKQRTEKRRVAAQQLRALIDSLDVDEVFRRQLVFPTP